MALSRGNSSTAPLASDAVFTGTAEDVSASASWEISVYSVGTGGSLVTAHSTDALTWTTTDTFAVADGSFLRVSRNVVARYFRCVFTNGTGTQTEFRLTTRYSAELVSTGAAFAGQLADPEDSGMVVFAIRDDAVSTLATAENEYVPLRVGSTGALHVGVASVTPGTSATSLGKAEDSAHSSGDVGVMSLGVRNDTLTTLAGSAGDYAPLQVNASGALYTSVVPRILYGNQAVTEAGHSVTGAPGHIWSLFAYNPHGSTISYLKVYNTGTATVGTTPAIAMFPLNAGVAVTFDFGGAAFTGLSVACTAAATDASADAPPADAVVNLTYT